MHKSKQEAEARNENESYHSYEICKAIVLTAADSDAALCVTVLF